MQKLPEGSHEPPTVRFSKIPQTIMNIAEDTSNRSSQKRKHPVKAISNQSPQPNICRFHFRSRRKTMSNRSYLRSLFFLFMSIQLPPVMATININGTQDVSAFQGLPGDYETWTAAAKYAYWNDTLTVEANNAKAGQKSGDFPSLLGKLQFLITDDFSPTFEWFRDDLPYTHTKRIRSVGGVGLVKWHPSTEPHPYTGYFATGTPYALIRLSYTSPNDESGTTPGLSLKIFRDGIPSSNMLAMESLGGQSSGNFFEFGFSNHLAPAKSPLLRYVSRRFSRYSCPSTKTGLLEIATSTEAIQSAYATKPSVEFPYRVIFRPNPDLTARFANYPPEESLFDTLTAIEVGTKMYDIYAVTGPDDGTEMQLHVGHLDLTKRIQPSLIGDRFLFFRHQKIEEDYQQQADFDVQGKEASRCPAGFF